MKLTYSSTKPAKVSNRLHLEHSYVTPWSYWKIILALGRILFVVDNEMGA